MNRSLFTLFGASAAIALAAAACTVKSIDDDSGTGGSGAQGGSAQGGSAQGGSAQGGTGGSGAQGGAGGGAACLSCSEFITNGGTFPDDLCGDDPVNQVCEPGSSCELAEAYLFCACGDLQNDPGMCGGANGECTDNLCAGMGESQACSDCIDTSCDAALNACSADI